LKPKTRKRTNFAGWWICSLAAPSLPPVIISIKECGERNAMAKQKPAEPPVNKEKLALLKRLNTHNPSQADIEAARALMSENIDAWRQIGDMLLQSQHHFIQRLTGSTLTKEAMAFSAEKMREELTIKDAGPLDRMLVDHVVFCWVRLGIFEHQFTNNMNQG